MKFGVSATHTNTPVLFMDDSDLSCLTTQKLCVCSLPNLKIHSAPKTRIWQQIASQAAASDPRLWGVERVFRNCLQGKRVRKKEDYEPCSFKAPLFRSEPSFSTLFLRQSDYFQILAWSSEISIIMCSYCCQQETITCRQQSERSETAKQSWQRCSSLVLSMWLEQ